MESILITGGTGFIGSHTIDKLRSIGMYNILVLSRKYRQDTDGIRYIQGDITNSKIVNEIIGRVDYVIHMAGCKRDEKLCYSTNVTGTINIIDACAKYKIKRLVYLSSVGVVGPSNTCLVDENAKCNPSNNYERSKYQAEILVKKYSNDNIGKALILRPTNVYGECDPEKHLLNLISKIKHNNFYYVGKDYDRYQLNYLYVKEISELIPRLLTIDCKSVLYVINTPTLLIDFIATIKDILSNHNAVYHLPYPPVKLASMFFDIIPKKIISTPPINSLKLAELTNRKVYSARLISDELNWSPVFSMYTSIKNLINYYGNVGVLR